MGFLIVFIVALSLRQTLLNYGFSRAQKSLERKGFVLSAEELAFHGIYEINMTNLQIATLGKIPVLQCDTLKVNISPVSGIFGLGWVDNVHLAHFNLELSDSLRLKSEDKTKEPENGADTETPKSPESQLQEVKKILKQLPDEVFIQELRISMVKNGLESRIIGKQFRWEDESLKADIQIEQNQKKHRFNVDGDLNRHHLNGKLLIKGTQKAPVLFSVLGGDFGFSQMECSIERVDADSKGIQIEAACKINNAYARHERISDTLVSIDALEGAPKFRINSAHIEIDSSSFWKINQFNFYAGAHYPISDTLGPRWALLKFDKPSGAQFFNSMPAGLFRYTSGIEIEGAFSHRFYVWYSPKNISQTQLEAAVDYDPNFKVVKWGKANPNKINGAFHHDYYDGDRWEAGFEVGPSNPFYASLNQISPLLIESTLRSEDPSFYGHKGFYLEAFREALMANLREKRFARGGSTLTMQLIKNVYLRQHKTLTRKLEEILLVWLIEHERAVSKQRMLEVYFNIIEWGPNIFGVGAASQFYFGKQPSQLNMGESCYLSSLIPAPSKSRWSVDSTGNVNPRWSRYFKLKNRIMRLDSTRFSPSDFEFNIRAFKDYN